MLGNRWQTDNLYNFTPVDFININRFIEYVMYKNRLTSLTKTLEIPLMSDSNLVTDIKSDIFSLMD